MKFSCEKKDISRAISIVSKAVAIKSVLPVLECILLTVIDKDVTLKATNTTLSIKTMFEAVKSERNGIVAVPCRIFQDLISKYPEGEISFETKDGVLHLKSGSASSSIKYLPGDEFPQFPLKDMENTIKMPEILFKKMVNQTVFATAQTEDKPILTGMLFEKTNGVLTVVALDGYRLALRKEEVVTQGDDINVVIPAKSLKECSKILEDSDDEITICMSKANVAICMNKTEVFTRVLEGEFIKYKTILSTEKKTLAKTYVEDLLTAIERASIFSRDENNNLIKIKFAEDTIVVTANSEMGKAYEKMPADIEGKDIEIAFNARYISDVLKSIEESDVSIILNSNISPCIIKAKENEKYMYLVSPVQVRG